MKAYTFWFITGTQTLYGDEVIHQVNEHANIMAAGWNDDARIPCTIIPKGAVIDAQSIKETIMAANNDPACAGVITWMHTFSPSKMWIPGLKRLQKPWLHLNTQFNRDIPWGGIDMDFMNLNQSAHGDREHGFIGARMRMPRKVISGFWQDDTVKARMGHWMRSAVGAYESNRLKVCRFGDNMRDVAVTEGNKVEAEIKLGWSVNGYGVGDLLRYIDAVSEAEIDAKMEEYRMRYDMATENIEAVRYQAREEVAMRRFMEEGGFGAFTNTFQDLQQMRQLPGLATQNMMRDGYGFGAEGDWKLAGLGRVMKLMAKGLPGGTAFMEDYTYHMEPGREAILGAHMLEVDPDIAADRPKIEVYPLGIGDREDPARLTFQTGSGKAIVATLVDMGDHLRMIVNDVEACTPYEDMPKLPTARVMWKPYPNLYTSAEAWIQAGGAHHTILSYQLDAEHLRDFCTMMDIEFVHIGADTKMEAFEKELLLSDMLWKLR
ncbi:MAG: L-arabinose isomerase [Clostridia bacterium]|nr:L-arabinose isomerase [Clostridia bacterium]